MNFPIKKFFIKRHYKYTSKNQEKNAKNTYCPTTIFCCICFLSSKNLVMQ